MLKHINPHKFTKSWLLLVVGMLLSFSVCAQNDHLEPVESIFDHYNLRFKYYSKIRTVLMDGMSPYPEVRFLVVPSFSAEKVVSIEVEDGNYYIIYHEMEESIWYTKKNPKQIKVRKKKVEITKSDMLLFQELFKQAIRNRKYPDEEFWGSDGTNFYFSVADKRLKTGTVWSPSWGTKMRRLVEIGNMLIRLAKDTDSGELASLSVKQKEEIMLLSAEIE